MSFSKYSHFFPFFFTSQLSSPFLISSLFLFFLYMKVCIFILDCSTVVNYFINQVLSFPTQSSAMPRVIFLLWFSFINSCKDHILVFKDRISSDSSWSGRLLGLKFPLKDFYDFQLLFRWYDTVPFKDWIPDISSRNMNIHFFLYSDKDYPLDDMFTL